MATETVVWSYAVPLLAAEVETRILEAVKALARLAIDKIISPDGLLSTPK